MTNGLRVGPSLQAVGIQVGIQQSTRVGADGETSVPLLNLFIVGLVSSLAAGIFLATLKISPHK